MHDKDKSVLDLHSGKHGLTTVWLLSMLSANQNIRSENKSKRVCKKEILTLSIPETCTVIKSNTNEISLRHISNLVYGVSVCYRRKADYVLEDLNVILIQLQKIRYYSAQLPNSNKTTLKLDNIFNPHQDVGYLKLDSKQHFMLDDPSFDIKEMISFDKYLKKALEKTHFFEESSTIKKKDILNEIRNENEIDSTNFELSKYARPTTLEEIPIDLDFNLDIGEIISSRDHKGDSLSNSHQLNSDLTYSPRKERHGDEFSSAKIFPVKEDVGSFDLEIQEHQEENEQSYSKLESSKNISKLNQRKRKFDNSNECLRYVKRIDRDDRTNLFTDVLRRNQDGYVENMRVQKKLPKKIEKRFNWKQEINAGINSLILKKCWNFISSKELKVYTSRIKDSHLIENGRQNYSGSEHGIISGSIRSSEVGRKLDTLPFESGIFVNSEFPGSFRENSNNNSNVLLNLEQIDEDLEEGYNLNPITDFHPENNFMSMRLNLPTSSYGRNLSRTGTFNLTQTDRDIVDILEWNHGSTRNEDDINNELEHNRNVLSETEKSEKSTDTNTRLFSYTGSLDHQTKKFYDYIVNKIKNQEKEETSIMSNKYITFTSVVPETVFNSETQKTFSMSKRIAAGAFLSLLNLASKNMVHLSQDLRHSENTRNDLIIYI